MAGEELLVDYEALSAAATQFGGTSDVFKKTLQTLTQLGTDLQGTSFVGKTGQAANQAVEGEAPKFDEIIKQLADIQTQIQAAIQDYTGGDQSIKIK